MPPPPFRTDLRAFLESFVAQHRGLRFGRLFGRPAGYVGRRLFASLMDDGLLIRLPNDVAADEIRKGREPLSRQDRKLGRWVMYRPRTATAAQRLVPLLEVAARHIAERMTEDITGVTLPPRRRPGLSRAKSRDPERRRR